MTKSKESEQLQEFLSELLNSLQIDAEVASPYQEHNFFDYATELLSEAGIYDNIEQKDFRDINRGMKIDGFNWNPLERILSGIIVNFSGDSSLGAISKAEIEKLGKQTAKFIGKIEDKIKTTENPNGPQSDAPEIKANTADLDLKKDTNSGMSDLKKP